MLWRLLKWTFLLGLAAIIVVTVLLLRDMPSPRTPVDGSTVTILDRRGQELAIYGVGGGRAVPLERLPGHLLDAVIAIEDRRFRHHFGVDPLGILRAVWTNVTSGRVVQGGSTITQQLAKNLYLGPERTLKRKAQEAVLAVILEARFSKDEILELYLNRVYFGAGTYGVAAASARYFAKPASQLGLREAAMLAGLLKAPSRYDPTRNPKGAENRMRLVVQAMVDAERLDAEVANSALASPMLPVARPRNEGIRYASDLARERLDTILGRIDGDLVVRTTIDAGVQTVTADALGRRLSGSPHQGAAVVLGPGGAILAIVGGRNYGESQYNRAIRARRQPASTFKPFFYLAALEAGWRREDTILDAPITVDGWTPGNFRNRFLGEITLTEALARSVNAGIVRLTESVGRERGIAAARRLGIDADLADHPSVVLGVEEVSVLELATAYLPMGNGGLGFQPHLIERIEDGRGREVYRHRPGAPRRVIEAPIAGDMAQMLRAAITDGSGRNAALTRDAGGKTGTTQNSRDAWFAGFTADRTAVVWVGRDDAKPMKNVGGSGLPALIWKDVMNAAHRGVPPRTLPEGRAPRSAEVSIARREKSAEQDEEGGLFQRIRRFLEGGSQGDNDGERKKQDDYQIEIPR